MHTVVTLRERAAPSLAFPPTVLQQEDQTKGEALRFEIMRLDDVDGSAVDSTVVDAASVNRIVQQAASVGQRIYIRPAETSAS